MYSLYHALLAQHARQLTPVRCSASTISQLTRYFEDVVLESNRSALVIESLATSRDRMPRELSRLKELGGAALSLFLMVSPDDSISQSLSRGELDESKFIVLEKRDQAPNQERFMVIADARFSALLCVHEDDGAEGPDGDLVVWTFEPDIVFSALEYLLARVTAEYSAHAAAFAEAVRLSMPKATSLQLTLGVTTKLARLLQDHAEREIAVNRIATAMRSSQRLHEILQTAATEVGRALSVPTCVVRVFGDELGNEVTKSCENSSNDGNDRPEKFAADLDTIGDGLTVTPKTYVDDDDHREASSEFAQAAVPLICHGKTMGFLLVRSADRARLWAHNELMLLHTVADQLTVAVSQARLFAEMERQALTDSLTGCYNRRAFDLQLERDLHLATRMRQSLSLVLIDIDGFKRINDHSGHDTGDIALCLLSEVLRKDLRAVDTAVRFGGDEFAVILPQANRRGALLVAERLRARIQGISVPGYGHFTASLGIASFPQDATARNRLIVVADRALYSAKHCGGDCVGAPPTDDIDASATDELVLVPGS